MEDKRVLNQLYFLTRENIAESLRIWEGSALLLVDIRHNLISSKEALSDYSLPASAFIYTCQPKAEVILDHSSYLTERFGVFHAGKGTRLSLLPADGWLEYYMVFYKSGESVFHKRKRERLLKQVNPFQQQYGFAPENPIFLMELLQSMYEAWRKPSALERFYEKAAFYQLVYEIYRELERGEIGVLQPDMVALVKRYLEENYMEVVSMQKLADIFDVSLSHLSRTFKQRYGKGPQAYLKKVRMDRAYTYLLNGQLTLKEIAVQIGFMDEYHFSRMFKQEYGISPDLLRQKTSFNTSNSSIENRVSFLYNEKNQVSLDKLKEEGTNNMFRKNKIIAVASLSLLLLSACGTSAASGTNDIQKAGQDTEIEATQTAEAETKLVSTVMGEIEIPVNAKRVACYTWTGDLLSLGIVPIASNDVNLGATKELLKGTTQSLFREPEEIMELEPDLIIIRDEDQYESFSQIAPCIVVPYETSLEERMKLFGEVFDKEEEAQEVLDAFNNKIERYKEELKEAGIYGKSIALCWFMDENSLMAFGDDYGFGGQILYKMLGFSIPDIIQTELIDKGEGNKNISWEVAPEYLDADYIQVSFNGDMTIDSLKDNELWNSVRPVKEGNIIEYSVLDFDRKSLYLVDKALDFYYEQFLGEEE